MSTGKNENSTLPENAGRLPTSLWIAAALVGLVRTIPFFVTRAVAPAAGTALLPIGYLPKDTLTYVALIRQQADTGSLCLFNPFTTEAQSGRFVLLFFQLLGWIVRLTGIDPFWLLELSRIPLVMILLYVLWQLLLDILPERRHRVWACWLVLLSGGVEFVLRAFSGLQQMMSEEVQSQLWTLIGWSTFQSFWNPLWIAALILSLSCVRAVFTPERVRSPGSIAWTTVKFLLLYFTHPYSFVAVAAVTLLVPALSLLLGARDSLRRYANIGIALGASALVIGVTNAWQSADEVYRRSAGNVFGSQAVPIFWYPLTLGATGIFALRGFKTWVGEQHPYRYQIGAWILAVALLHTSPLLNGYKFLFHLYIPVCIAAGPALSSFFEGASSNSALRFRQALVLPILFAAAIPVTLDGIRETETARTEVECLEVVDFLKSREPGNVFAPAVVGNIIPAYTRHRVYVGQWFLTPDYQARSEEYMRILSDPLGNGGALQTIVQQHRIAYCLIPTFATAKFKLVIGSRVREEKTFGNLTLLTLAVPTQ